jgi:hypothetical protein
MSIEEESPGERTNRRTGSKCLLCRGYGYIVIYRSDWEEFEEVECSCHNKLRKLE